MRRLPLSVAAGSVGSVSIDFDPSSLTSKQIKVEIEDVFVVLRLHPDGRVPKPDTDSDSDEEDDDDE